MGRILKFFKSLFKRKSFWIILVIILAAGGYIYAQNIESKKITYTTEDAKIGNVKRTVSATGTVTAADKIDLNFEMAGTLVEVMVLEGDEVKAGQVLAKIDGKNAEIQVQQAEANLASASANLSKLLAGASSEDIKISQESVNNAKISYDNARRDYDALAAKLDKDIETYEKTIANAETTLADSQKNLENAKVTYGQNTINSQNNALTSMETNLLLGDIILNNINYNLSILVGITTDQQKIRDAQTSRQFAVSESATAKSYLSAAKLSGSKEDVYAALNQSLSALNKVLASLTYLSDAVSAAAAGNTAQLSIIETVKAGVKADQISTTSAISAVQSSQQSLLNSENSYQSQIDTYQAAVNAANNTLLSARTNLFAALANKDVQLSQSRASVDNALGAYNLSKAQYNYKVAPPRSSDVAYYRAQVSQSAAAMELTKSQLDKYTLLAPADGRISFVNYSVGEQTSLAKPVMSMLGKSRFYVEVDIPESDIVKIEAGDPVQITLDAYSEDTKFNGKITLLYPAETVVQDVVYYKVKVEIDDTRYEIKSGMTANCDILTAKKDNVLTVPYRAVQEENGVKFVRVLVNDQPVLKNVTVGLRGDEGEIEVVSGLAAGEKVIVFEKKQ